MSAYSLDLREKIVESVKKGVSKSETARRFGIDRTTVKHYCKQLRQSTQRFVQTHPFPRLAIFIQLAKDRFEPTT
jgi:transposase-like protein